MKIWLENFKKGLKKTTPNFVQALNKVKGLWGNHKFSPEDLESLEMALISADFGLSTTTDILSEIKTAHKKNPELRGQEAALIGQSVLQNLLQGSAGTLTLPPKTCPEVICMIGVNGAGKTTTTAKLAHTLQSNGQSVLLGACDTFRAAANQQIQGWADRLSIEWVSSQQGADSASVAFDSYVAAVSRKKDFLILDTAGRLHNKSNLMQELQKIRRVLTKQHKAAPQHSWLVVDGSLGSNSIEQARKFHQEFGLTGMVITKLDGTSRGGALVGIYRELKIPIYYIGLGEQPEDLQPYQPETYAKTIFAIDT